MGLHPLIGNTSWGFYVRILQFIFAALVMSLAAYTLSIAPGWREDRFTVAAGAWGVLSVLWILSSGMAHRPRSHHLLIHFFEFTNWGLFLAVWIALVVNIGKKQECYFGGHSHIRPCDTIYATIAFAIVEWLLFTVTLGLVTLGYLNASGNANTAGELSNTAGTAKDAAP